jgi:hypothetical protein
MGAGDKCCVGGCDNDRRYPGKYHVHSHVQKLGFHKPSNSEDAIKAWCIQVQKGRKDFKIGKSRESVIVCSNHFVDGKPTRSNPIPTLFLTPFVKLKKHSLLVFKKTIQRCDASLTVQKFLLKHHQV